MYDVKNIKNYILFLKRECGLYITLHPYGDESLITQSELITFNIHDNPYCIYVKTFDGVWQHCIESQHKVRDKCKAGSFCGTCFAGVKEYVYPINNGSELLGFISVSGYSNDRSASYRKKIGETYNIPEDVLTQTYSHLKKDIPSKEWVDTLVLPLCNMLELYYVRSNEDKAAQNDLFNKILRYIKRHHTQNIILEQICKHFGVSRSYLSHSFKKNMGKGFREYLTELRLEDAKSLLKYSNLTVTEIALSVGFSDSTYFSNVFKAKVGTSPSHFRKQ